MSVYIHRVFISIKFMNISIRFEYYLTILETRDFYFYRIQYLVNLKLISN